MAILKDFECYQCKHSFEQAVDMNQSITKCEQCGKNEARVVFLTVPAIPEMESDFRPHYDLRFGEHFHTAAEKREFLKRKGQVQVDGEVSPRKDNKIRKHCTKDQAHKVWGIQSQLPATPKARQHNPDIRKKPPERPQKFFHS